MCSKIPLYRRAKIAGVVDMTLSAIGMVGASYDIFLLVQWNRSDHVDHTEDERNSSLISLYIALGISVLKFAMGFTLYNGAHNRNDTNCRQWLFVSLALWCLQVVNLVVKLIFGAFVLFSTITTLLAIAIRVFVMASVYRFMDEIRRDSISCPVPIV